MNKLKTALNSMLPTAALIAIIVLLLGIAFLPVVRRGSAPTVATQSDTVIEDPAVDVLEMCEEYAAEHGFSTRLSGKVKASVLGIPYSVTVSGGRTVCGEEFCDVEEGVSALVKFGQKKQCVGGEYAVARGEYKDKAFVYGDAAAVERDSFIERYGMPPVRIVKYITDDTVISARQIDENTFVYTLDAERATEYYRREGRTVLKCEECPTYSAVTITLITDGMRAVKITAEEKLHAPKMGGVDCTAVFTEVFDYN